jgi:hypothetical protein
MLHWWERMAIGSGCSSSGRVLITVFKNLEPDARMRGGKQDQTGKEGKSL